MIFYLLVIPFFLLQTAAIITAEMLFQLDGPRVTHLLAAPSELEYIRTFASVFVCVSARKMKTFSCSPINQSTCVFYAQGAYEKYYRHSLMDRYTNSMPLPQKLSPNKCKIVIRKLFDKDRVEIKQFFYIGSFTFFDKLSFLV